MSPHFSILGIPVRVHGSFWLTALLMGYFSFRSTPWAIAIWVPAVFVAVLLHEMGHALMARRFGLPSEVHLVAMGGLTRFPAGRLSHWRSILVSFAGPAVGLVIGGLALVFALFGPSLPVGGDITLWIVIYTNLGWALLNLVPIVPLDGGQIVSSILDRFFGMRGQRWARLLSVVVACAIVALGLATGRFFLVFIVAMLAMENYRAWQMESHWSEGLRDQARDRPRAAPAAKTPEPIEAQLREGWSALEEGDAKRVRRIAESLVARARDDDDRYEVAHLLAWGRTLTGDPEGASEALRLLPRGRLPDALLEGTILLDLGRRREAVRPLSEAIVDRPDDFVATRLARAASGAARYDEVITLLGDRSKSDKVGARALQIVVNEAFYAGHHEAAAKMFALLFERFGQANDAFNAACALGQAGRALEGIEWLRKAVEAGLADPTVLDTDDDLAPLRALPGYETLRVKAGLAD